MLTENSSRTHMSNPHSPHSSASGRTEQEQLLRVEALQLLRQKADEPYRIFSGKLLPPETPLLGVRIPHLRHLANHGSRREKPENIWRFPVRVCFIMKSLCFTPS